MTLALIITRPPQPRRVASGALGSLTRFPLVGLEELGIVLCCMAACF